jgi:hypothetical protein
MFFFMFFRMILIMFFREILLMIFMMFSFILKFSLVRKRIAIFIHGIDIFFEVLLSLLMIEFRILSSIFLMILKSSGNNLLIIKSISQSDEGEIVIMK